jgi:tetratricopeptide (TPR) repeat protein
MNELLSSELQQTDHPRKMVLDDAIRKDTAAFISDPELADRVLSTISGRAERNWKAACRMGVLCTDGLYFEKEAEEAFRYFKSALDLCPEADERQADIQTALGYCYMKGFGTKADREKAIFHFQNAVSLNEDPLALLLISDLLGDGSGTEFDSVRSIRAFQRMLRGWCRRSSAVSDWRIRLYIEIRLVRKELYDMPLYPFGYHSSEEDRDAREMEAHRVAGIAIRLIDLSEELKVIAAGSNCPEVKDMYVQLKKDLGVAADAYHELDPDSEILRQEGSYDAEYLKAFLENRQF